MKFVDLTGKRFERLTVLRRNGYLNKDHRAWLCLCGCGKKTTVRNDHLLSGNTKSCGCLKKKNLTENHRTINGLSKHPLYWVWVYMRKRCGIIKGVSSSEKKYYITRGITVCNEWRTFLPFYEWAKDKWKLGLQMDRKDNNGNYTPSNCRFTTRKINQQNTRKSKRWHVSGVKYNSLSDAAAKIGVTPMTVLRWCNGYEQHPQKKDCYAVKLY